MIMNTAIRDERKDCRGTCHPLSVSYRPVLRAPVPVSGDWKSEIGRAQ